MILFLIEDYACSHLVTVNIIFTTNQLRHNTSITIEKTRDVG